MNQDHPDIENLPLEIDGIPVRETIREFFAQPDSSTSGLTVRLVDYGTPDKINKAGCLALALKSNEVGGEAGHVVWNAWRACFPARVDFSGYQSFGNDEPDFSFFQFGDYANFANARITRARFSGAVWGNYSIFDGAVFGPVECKFQLAQWGDNASFCRTQWDQGANFEGAKWGRRAIFNLAQWGKDANFCAAEWLGDASFRGARWGDKADFSDAQWRAPANFESSQWAGSAVFRATRWGGDVNFQGVGWEQLKQRLTCYEAIDQARQWSDERNAGPDIFHDLDFSGASFEKRLDFTGRQFLGFANFEALPKGYEKKTVIHDQATLRYFRDLKDIRWRLEKLRETHTRFQSAPVLDRCQNLHSLQFDDRNFPKATGNKQAEIAYRSLKHAFGQQQAVREEQRFFRLELEEERVRETGFKCFLLTLYKLSSCYGTSVWLPLFFWFVLAVISSGLYVEPSTQEACFVLAQNCTWDTEAFRRSLFHSVPFGGLPELKDHALSWCHSLGIVLHKAFALVFLFLIGLALRNLFKLK